MDSLWDETWIVYGMKGGRLWDEGKNAAVTSSKCQTSETDKTCTFSALNMDSLWDETWIVYLKF